MSKDASLLIIDDDPDILTAGKLLFKREVGSVTTCADPMHVPDLMAKQTFDVILLDMNFGPGESDGKQGLMWLEKILLVDPSVIVIMITAHGDMRLAVEAMKLGATDFVSKPWQNEKVLATVFTAIKLRQSQSEVDSLKQTNKVLSETSVDGGSGLIWGTSSAMRALQQTLQRAAPTEANVLILGENGTGKELIAREIHRLSDRNDQVFLSVDLGTISESLFESELFGHVKGAFTGANQNRVGRMQAANGGTLFLDELGNLPLHLQSRLLTALEQRIVTPVGSNQSVPIDIRVIAATNLSREKLTAPDHFRQDLLFRLNTVELHLPALRQRIEDIPLLAEHYIEHYCRKYNKAHKELSESAKQALTQYSWPGNVRALRHAVERAIILSEQHTLDVQDFQLNQTSLSTSASTPASASEAAESATTEQVIDSLNLDVIEKQTISRALKLHGYNISHAAKTLGLTRAALYRRMEKHDL